MFPWGDAPRPFDKGDRVYSGDCRGIVISVERDTFAIQWEDGKYGPITYPFPVDFIRKAMPWEL